MNVVHATLKLASVVRDEGLLEAADLVRKNISLAYWKWESARFDLRYGVDTSGQIARENLQIIGTSIADAVRYEPTTLRTFSGVIASLPRDLRGLTFVDFGSGKGRALMLASLYGFRRILGVEHARDLHEIALSNLKKFRDSRQQCRSIECICADAIEFPIPHEPCVFHFFQPFAGAVMATVLDNIRRSLEAHPRVVYLAFVHPHASLNRDVLLSFLQRVSTKALPFDLAWRHAREFELYRSRGIGSVQVDFAPTERNQD